MIGGWLKGSAQEFHPGFAAFPTYPVILGFKHTDQEIIDFYRRSKGATKIPGVPEFDSRRMVDGQRQITVLKSLPPTSAGREFELRGKVIGVYDKGKAGTVTEIEHELVEKSTGEVYTKILSSSFAVGQGNWGGPKGMRARARFADEKLTLPGFRTAERQLPPAEGQEARRYLRLPDFAVAGSDLPPQR